MRITAILTTACTITALTAGLAAGPGTGPIVAPPDISTTSAPADLSIRPTSSMTPESEPNPRPTTGPRTGPRTGHGVPSRPILHLTTTVVDATPLASDPATCSTRTVTLPGGLYSHGLRFGVDGDSYDRDGLAVVAGSYQMTDCLLFLDGSILQLARLRPAAVPDTGRDLSTVVQVREPPQSTGETLWGSFLHRVPDTDPS